MKPRILFVDDEQRILEGLERMLFPFLDRWDMVFVDSGEQALAQLRDTPFDVIVTDMKMPRMDGATLLTLVQENHPDLVRIVLSGHTELEMTLRALPVAHQFLTKPCEAQTLLEVIGRACNLRKILNEDNIRRMVRTVDRLPSRPKAYTKLNQALADSGTSMQSLTQIIEQDVGMVAKLLQWANSAFFGMPQKTTSLHQAVTYVGTNLLKHIILSFEIFQIFEDNHKIPNFSLDGEQRHVLFVAAIARALFKDKKRSEDAFTAALLHDVGKLILASNVSDQLAQVIALGREQKRPQHDVEAEILGVTHAAIGAYLLTLWGLPYPIVEAVAYHHNPWEVKHSSFDVVDAIYIANLLAHEQLDKASGQQTTRLNLPYLQQLGMTDQLPLWRETTVKIAAAIPSLS